MERRSSLDALYRSLGQHLQLCVAVFSAGDTSRMECLSSAIGKLEPQSKPCIAQKSEDHIVLSVVNGRITQSTYRSKFVPGVFSLYKEVAICRCVCCARSDVRQGGVYPDGFCQMFVFHAANVGRLSSPVPQHSTACLNAIKSIQRCAISSFNRV